MDVALVFNYFTLALGILIAYCTYKDYTSFEDSKSKKFYSIFSIYTNGKSLINLKQPDNAITCINGMKALSMPLIVFFHTMQIVMFETGVLSNVEYQFIKYRLLLTTAILPTETFFVLSGFLSVKGFLQNENSVFKLLKNFYYRYIRFTPSAAFFMLILLSIKDFNGLNGIFAAEYQNCKAYWWSMLLYSQTYINPSHMCIGPLWFASVSWHLFLLSPLILLLLKPRDRRIRLMVMGVILFITHIPGIVKYIEVGELVNTIQSYLYVETLTRSYPYLFGMFYYYEFYKIKDISRTTKLYLWTTTFMTLFFALIISINNPMPMEPTSVLFLITRILWPLALCWIIHASQLGCNGIVNKILSFKYFIPLSSISLGIYFLNDHIGHYVLGDVLRVFKDYGFKTKVFALCSSTYILATIFGALLYLCIEVPFYKLARFNIRSQFCVSRNKKVFDDKI